MLRSPSRLLAIVLVCSCASLRAADLTVVPDRPSGVYEVGEPIRWTIRGGQTLTAVSYTLKRGQLTDAGRGTLDLTGGAATVESRLDAPGTMSLEIKGTRADGKTVRVLGGAVADPLRIPIAATRPSDFDAFWASKLEELAAVPMNAQLEAAPTSQPASSPATAPTSQPPATPFWRITMDNIRGTKIRGQLSRPTGGEKFPALLIVQWAGVYPLQNAWVLDRARDGWLVLNITAHDLPIDEPEQFYKDQSAGPLKDYWTIGNDDRDQSYFLRMYLSCYRAADYLTQRPDWDGKTLVVMGGSQGGLQALMTAAIHPKVTAALAHVPAGCDTLGPTVGRRPGWPQWYDAIQGKDPAKVREASRYYDVVNFAPRIRCPVLVSVGLIDETCPPEGICAAVGQVSGPRELVVMPLGGHHGTNDSHAAYDRRCWSAWLPALREGKPAPVAP